MPASRRRWQSAGQVRGQRLQRWPRTGPELGMPGNASSDLSPLKLASSTAASPMLTAWLAVCCPALLYHLVTAASSAAAAAAASAVIAPGLPACPRCGWGGAWWQSQSCSVATATATTPPSGSWLTRLSHASIRAVKQAVTEASNSSGFWKNSAGSAAGRRRATADQPLGVREAVSWAQTRPGWPRGRGRALTGWRTAPGGTPSFTSNQWLVRGRQIPELPHP